MAEGQEQHFRFIPADHAEASLTMDAWERQQVFREMVARMLRDGPLSARRRRHLVQYAAALDINAVLAGRLIDQAHGHRFDRGPSSVQPHAGHGDQCVSTEQARSMFSDESSKMPPGAFVWTAMAGAIIIATLTTLSLIY